MMALFLVLLFLASTLIPLHGQQGFVSIDCGYDGDSYPDDTTGLTYVSDAKYIDTGKTYSVPRKNTHGQPMQTWYVRSFSDGDRNCYTLDKMNQGAKYLIRASFLYGDYDGLDTTGDRPIIFDLYLGVNIWRTINVSYIETLYVAEIVTIALTNYFSVCLVNTNSGVPFISALELRPIDNNKVFKDVNQSVSLVLSERYNLHPFTSDVLRYPDDKYDRTWKPCVNDLLCGGLHMNTTSLVQQSNADPYDVPLKAMQTAGASIGGTFSYYLDAYNNGIIRPTYYIYLHFAELYYLNGNGSRSFQVRLVGQSNVYSCSPTYLLATHISFNYVISTADEFIYFNLTSLNGSTLPPMLNAAEVYTAINLPDLATDQGDGMSFVANNRELKLAESD